MPFLAYAIACALSLLRLPLALAPYLCKICLFHISGGWLQKHWDDDSIQLLRIVGDALNALIAGYFLYLTSTWGGIPSLEVALTLALSAELTRLCAEKGMMLFSAGWQVLPHRQAAAWLEQRRLTGAFDAYCRYYQQTDEARLEQILETLRCYASHEPKLRYLRGFQIVPESTGLRCGQVRDIAHGVVYIHARWSNHPGLLYGLALRRSPWIFDPRYLARPFFYRTQANRQMTLLVFEHARLCPLYAVYQFGHEIKTARYEAFFRLARWLGLPLEKPVRANGVYAFEPLAVSLRIIPSAAATPSALWNDDEVLRDLAGKATPSPLEIAERYTYPLLYVEEVLLPKIESQTASATAAGASQCG